MKKLVKLVILICLVFTLLGGMMAFARGANEEERPDKEEETKRSESFSWTSYEGTKIKVMANKHPWTELIEPHIGEFEELTGIDVDLDIYPEDQFRTKRTVELVSGSSDVDVFMMMPGQVLAPYTQSGWLHPLNDFISSKNLLWPEYELDDVYQSSLNAGKRDGKNYTVPLMLETSILAYNKEILNEYDISIPETMEELEDAAAKIYSSSAGDIYGITLRGKKAAATSCWVGFLYSFGGSWLDANEKAAVNSPEAVEATEYYGKLLREYGPKSAPNNSWYESISLFMQGKAAIIFDSNVFKKNYENEEKSLIHDKVGYAIIPKGKGGSRPPIFTWSLGMYSNSDNKEGAWLFMQWATSKEMALRGQMVGVPSARKSAWESDVFINNDDSPEWTKASMDSFQVGNPEWNPPVIPIAECREAMGNAIVDAILGEDVEAACFEAAEQINTILADVE